MASYSPTPIIVLEAATSSTIKQPTLSANSGNALLVYSCRTLAPNEQITYSVLATKGQKLDIRIALDRAKLQIRKSDLEIARLTAALREANKKAETAPKKRIIG